MEMLRIVTQRSNRLCLQPSKSPAKLSVLSAHLADSIARLLTLPYIYLDFVKMISTIKK